MLGYMMMGSCEKYEIWKDWMSVGVDFEKCVGDFGISYEENFLKKLSKFYFWILIEIFLIEMIDFTKN